MQLVSPSEPNFFLPKGRIGRGTYATRVALCLIIIACLAAFAYALPPGIDRESPVIFIGFLVILIYISAIKRIHDIGYTGWAAVVLIPAPFFAIFLCFFRSESVANDYGPPDGGRYATWSMSRKSISMNVRR